VVRRAGRRVARALRARLCGALRGALALAACFAAACGGEPAAVGSAAPAQTVIQYDCIPNYANWGGVTQAYFEQSGVRVPPDMKGSSAALAALEAEVASPRADTAYYSGAIGYQAAQRGLHEPYKPAGWERIPAELKDPEGRWWTVHLAHIAILVNREALGARPLPRSFADLLHPEYRGLVAYDDPRIHGTSFTFIYGVNALLGGGPDLDAGFAYLRRLHANALKYPKENSYNDLVRGEIPIWINADGNGLKARYVDGAPIEVVIPSEGAIAMPLVMGLVRGAPHPEAARRYLDWLLGEDAQLRFAQAFFRPVLPLALPPELEARFPPPAAYAVRHVPSLAQMAQQADAVKRRWEAEVASQ
jgi:putative spermidine/putrescine transport system substrate-binding protein